MVAIARAGPGQNQESKASSVSSIWYRNPTPWPSSPAFPYPLAESCIGSGMARIWTSALVRGWCYWQCPKVLCHSTGPENRNFYKNSKTSKTKCCDLGSQKNNVFLTEKTLRKSREKKNQKKWSEVPPINHIICFLSSLTQSDPASTHTHTHTKVISVHLFSCT